MHKEECAANEYATEKECIHNIIRNVTHLIHAAFSWLKTGEFLFQQKFFCWITDLIANKLQRDKWLIDVGQNGAEKENSFVELGMSLSYSLLRNKKNWIDLNNY